MRKKYIFGDFLLCTHNGLYRGGKVISLASKELKVLEVLVSSAENIVSKENIITQAWQGGVVSDESLCRCIYVLRRALKTHNQDQIIQTVYGRGYRFMHKVRVERENNHQKNSNTSKSIYLNQYNNVYYGCKNINSINYTLTPLSLTQKRG